MFSVPPVVQLWQSLCNSRPLPPHDWPCRHIQCGDYGKSMRPTAAAFFVCTLSETSRHELAHTQELTLRNKDQRLQRSLVFIYVFIHQLILVFCHAMWHTLVELSGTVNPRHVKLAQTFSATNLCYATSCNINLTRVPS